MVRWLLRKGTTRSHSELGRETLLRQWYFSLSCGRVGHCRTFYTLVSLTLLILPFLLLYPPCPRLLVEGSFFFTPLLFAFTSLVHVFYVSSCPEMRVQQAMLGKILDEVDLLQQVISSQDQAIKNLSKALTDMVGRIDGLEKHTQKGKLRKGYTIRMILKKPSESLLRLN